MNEMHDDQVIAQLRSALDEVAAGARVHSPGAPSVSAMTPRRWVAVAAAAVLVAGAVVGLATYHGDHHTYGTPAPTTTSVKPSSPGLTMPYVLVAPDLTPGPVTRTAVGAIGSRTTLMAWVRNDDLASGVLMLSAAAPGGTADTANADDRVSVRVLDGTTLVFGSYGLTAAERETLAAQVIPGSGLPWLLPVDGWTLLDLFSPTNGRQQTFGGIVTLAVGSLVDHLFTFAQTDRQTITAVTVAGVNGWRISAASETVVAWRDASSGEWASLTIPATMTHRVDELIAAVRPH